MQRYHSVKHIFFNEYQQNREIHKNSHIYNFGFIRKDWGKLDILVRKSLLKDLRKIIISVENNLEHNIDYLSEDQHMHWLEYKFTNKYEYHYYQMCHGLHYFRDIELHMYEINHQQRFHSGTQAHMFLFQNLRISQQLKDKQLHINEQSYQPIKSHNEMDLTRIIEQNLNPMSHFYKL